MVAVERLVEPVAQHVVLKPATQFGEGEMDPCDVGCEIATCIGPGVPRMLTAIVAPQEAVASAA